MEICHDIICYRLHNFPYIVVYNPLTCKHSPHIEFLFPVYIYSDTITQIWKVNQKFNQIQNGNLFDYHRLLKIVKAQ